MYTLACICQKIVSDKIAMCFTIIKLSIRKNGIRYSNLIRQIICAYQNIAIQIPSQIFTVLTTKTFKISMGTKKMGYKRTNKQLLNLSELKYHFQFDWNTNILSNAIIFMNNIFTLNFLKFILSHIHFYNTIRMYAKKKLAFVKSCIYFD